LLVPFHFLRVKPHRRLAHQTRKNYSQAIQALQIALRADTDDQIAWLRLGEAYSRGGRHAAAMKALARARELDPDDWMCSFFIGEVQRQMGQYQEAVDSFQSILVSRPLETGVMMSLAQTYLDLGLHELSAGFTARAEQSFVACLCVATQAIDASPGFRGVAWKTAGDAIFHLSGCQVFSDEESVRTVLSGVVPLISVLSERLSGIVHLSNLQDMASFNSLRVLEIAIAAYDYRISVTSSESSPSGSTWFDLGSAFHTWAKRSSSVDDKQKAAKQAASCFTEALRQDPSNESYWNALGTINFEAQPMSAQHAYIKALEINSKVSL
jgi:superkiller protein 3